MRAMIGIGVDLLSAMSPCKCGIFTAFQTTWPQPNNQHNFCLVTDSPPWNSFILKDFTVFYMHNSLILMHKLLRSRLKQQMSPHYSQ